MFCRSFLSSGITHMVTFLIPLPTTLGRIFLFLWTFFFFLVFFHLFSLFDLLSLFLVLFLLFDGLFFWLFFFLSPSPLFLLVFAFLQFFLLLFLIWLIVIFGPLSWVSSSDSSRLHHVCNSPWGMTQRKQCLIKNPYFWKYQNFPIDYLGWKLLNSNWKDVPCVVEKERWVWCLQES